MTHQKPIHQIKLGRIRASIWANETKRGILHSVSLGRLYKEGESWKTSTSFNPEDLLLAAKALDEAHTFILAQPDSDSSSE